MAGIAEFEWEELTTSFHGSVAKGDGSVVREFKIDWTQLPAFLMALRGGWTMVSESSWTFTPADRLTGSWSNYYCETADFDSFGQAFRTGDASSWDYAHVIATYKIPQYDPNENSDPANIMEENLDFDVDVLMLPEGAFKKKGGGADDIINLPTKLTMPCITWNLKLINRPRLPLGGGDALASKTGMVNSAAFRGAAKHKVMYNGSKSSRSFVAADQPLGYTIDMSFKYRTIPWTYLYSPQEGKFVEVEPAKPAGQKLVDEYDLNLLLQSSTTIPTIVP
jgi:hypothetical protein